MWVRRGRAFEASDRPTSRTTQELKKEQQEREQAQVEHRDALEQAQRRLEEAGAQWKVGSHQALLHNLLSVCW
jgi:hypothetical protein